MYALVPICNTAGRGVDGYRLYLCRGSRLGNAAANGVLWRHGW